MNLIERARQEDKPPFYDQEMGAFIHYYRNPDGPALATEIERLTAQVERMREALGGYQADCTNEECERCINARAALSYRGGD